MVSKKWFLLIAALILLSVGLSLRAVYLGEAYKALKASAQAHGAKAEAAEVLAQRTLSEKAQLQGENAHLRGALAKALSSIPKVPPKPEVPEGAAEVQAQLQAAGLPCTVLEVTPSTLALPVARMVLSWQGDAARVPGLEASLLGTSRALGASQQLSAGLTRELVTTEQALQHQTVVVQECTLQVGDLTGANRKLEAKLATEAFNGKLKIVLAVPVALWIGYELGRR